MKNCGWKSNEILECGLVDAYVTSTFSSLDLSTMILGGIINIYSSPLFWPDISAEIHTLPLLKVSGSPEPPIAGSGHG